MMKILSLIIGFAGLTSATISQAGQFSWDNHYQNNPLYLSQNWNQTEREKFYYTPQGSLLIPYRWYLALETADSYRLFNNPWNMRRYGSLVDDHPSNENPDNLPVGFAREPMKNGEDWMGLTCAACHTTDIHYRGKTLRIDGAPTLLDFTAFSEDLTAALQATIDNKRRFHRFAYRVLGKEANFSERADLWRKVAEHLGWLKGFTGRSHPTYAYGPGRVDAFGVIMNEVFARELGIKENARIPDAPVSYPFLWGTPQHDFVQWTGSAFNPFGRNVGEVLGTFGRVNLDVKSADFGSTSARGRDLFELERLIGKLAAPPWPKTIFGEIDRDSAERGRVLYTQQRNGEESCADCHALKDANGRYPMTSAEENLFGATFVKTHQTPLVDIGTDPLTATNFALRKVNPDKTAPLLPAPFTNATLAPAPVVLNTLVGVAVLDSIKNAQPPFNLPEKAELIGYRQKSDGTPYRPPNLMAYRARPLDGIWATAPYLHNGSVPNLYELLSPPEQRSKVFYVGNREFDPYRVGFVSRPWHFKKAFRFDTRIPGNRNSGHLYGTELNFGQRLDLLEFLKTL